MESLARAHIDGLFTRLIEDLVVLEDVNPDRVYIMGYSAGGDGVYQLGPRMADSWAAAAMMGGHPNGVSIFSLRNVPLRYKWAPTTAPIIATRWRGNTPSNSTNCRRTIPAATSTLFASARGWVTG